MVNLQSFKIVKGTANNYLYENSTYGSNGTAVIHKVNTLIDELQTLFNNISKFTISIGNGVDETYTITHNLDTKDIVITIFDITNGEVIYPNVTIVDDDSITVTFGSIPSTLQYRVVIISV